MTPPSFAPYGGSSVERLVEQLAEVRAEFEPLLQVLQQRRDRRPASFALSAGKRRSVRAIGGQVPRRRPAGADARREPLQVGAGFEQLAQFAAEPVVLQQLLDGVEPGVDRGDVGERREHPVVQEPRAHRRDGAVEDREQRAVALAVAQRARQFEAAARHLVERQQRLRRGTAAAGGGGRGSP